jgi:hypothetical protein
MTAIERWPNNDCNIGGLIMTAIERWPNNDCNREVA